MTQTTRASAADRRDARAAAAAPDASGVFTHRQIVTILGGLMLGMFLAALDQTVVSTAIRTIADDLHGYDLQAWATTAFLITSTISTPLYGKLSDLYGRRPFYLFAIGIFVVGSMLCGLADSMYQLAAFRALQGIGAGGLMSLALAIIGDIVPPRERSRYQGFFMAVFGTSSVLGPVIGGFFAGQSSLLGITGWRWIFYINVPLGVAAFLVVMRVLHLPHTRREHRIDWPGALALIVCLVPLLIVAEQGRTWGWGSGRALLCYVIGAVGLLLFILAERAYKDDALLPLRLFSNRSFAIGSISSIVLGAGMFGGILLLPQYLQIVHGSSPTVAGLQMIPLVGGIMTGAMSSGIAISKTGRYKVFPLVGTVFIVAALVAMSLVIGADTSVWTLVPFMVLLGLGLGFNFQPVILAVQNAVRPNEMGVATSSVTFFRQMGGTIGVAAFLSILFTRLPTDIGKAVRDTIVANPALAPVFQKLGGSSGALSDTSFIQKLPSEVALPFKVGFSNTIDLVFLVAAAVVAVGFFVLLFLPEVPLRNESGIQARQSGAGEIRGRGDGDPADEAAEAAGVSAPASVAPDQAMSAEAAGATGQGGAHRA
ncbi:MAG: Drug resistance transporter, EmrB/QacA subfamily [Blastococcus sp.]|nr:Drug resistance transporter, EmrB/QacA subfamily [Blastococcus sp.]